jgi:hypothetical protein
MIQRVHFRFDFPARLRHNVQPDRQSLGAIETGG